MQKWLVDVPFSHFITIKPTPSLPFKRDEVIQQLRTIEFRLNKNFLPNTFPKWKSMDKFWMVGFPEGDGVAHQVHYHILLHSPSVLYNKTWYADVSADIHKGWMMMPSKNPFTGKMRKFCLDGKPLLNIQKVENNVAASIYGSKWMNRTGEGEDFFFPTPSNNKPAKVAH